MKWCLKISQFKVPVIIRSNTTGSNFFAAVKSLDVNIALSDNFILTAKNSNVKYLRYLTTKTGKSLGDGASENIHFIITSVLAETFIHFY